jgi:transposase
MEEIMTGKGIICMSMRELKRLKVVHEVIERHITQRVAAEMIGLSERQVRRLVSGVREEGDSSIVHKARGKPSNRRMPEKVKKRVVKLYKKKYLGFGPTLASEKLLEVDGIALRSG